MITEGTCSLGGPSKSMVEVKFPEVLDSIPEVNLKEEKSNGSQACVENVTRNGFSLILEPTKVNEYQFWKGSYQALN